MPTWIKTYGPWVIRALVVIVLLALVWALNSERSSREALSKELEREKLEKAGITSQLESRTWELSAAEKKIVEKDEAFAAEKARLIKELNEKPKVVTVVEWRTKEVPVYIEVSGTPRECPKPGEDGKVKDILLVEGDTGHAEVHEVTYETKNNNHVFLATASCWRDSPSKRLLFSSAIQGPAPVAERIIETQPARWGAGVLVAATPDKLGIGPAILFPTLNVFGLSLDTSAAAAFSSNGFVTATLQSGARWR